MAARLKLLPLGGSNLRATTACATQGLSLLLAIMVLVAVRWPSAAAAEPRTAPSSQTSSDYDKPSEERKRGADLLESKAKERFGALSAAELRLVRSAPYRNLTWSGPSSDPADPSNDPEKGVDWEPARAIRAELIRWLLSNAQVSRLVHPSGVGVAGARIVHAIDLSYAASEIPLTLVRCYVPEGFDLSYAHLGPLVVRDSQTGPVNADQAVLRGDLVLRYGRFGPLSLFRAQINGDLDLRGTWLDGEQPLSAVETRVEGDALFQEGFRSNGLLDFRLASIKGALSFNDAHFTGTRENGLTAERAVIGGTLYWVKVEVGPHTILDLGNARAGALWDDRPSWPLAGNLVLTG